MTLDDLLEWLPDDQLHVVETLAYVDQLIGRAGDLHFAHLEAGAFEPQDVVEGATTSVVVKSVREMPAALPRIVADVLNQLRSAVEHVLLVEVRRAEGRDLTQLEERALEMPTVVSAPAFASWPTSNRGRRSLTCLKPGRPLYQRIESLMPFHRRDPESHPLRVIAAFTNAAKHRAPAIASTRIARVSSDFGDERLVPAELEVRPVRVGDILATAPAGAVIPLSVWPSICLEHPETGSWKVLMKELSVLEEWVRLAAVPVLISGSAHVSRIRPRIDVFVPVPNLREAMANAPEGTSFDLDSKRIRAVVARMGLEETTILNTKAGEPGAVIAWTASLSDDEALDWSDRLIAAKDRADLALSWVQAVEAAVGAFVAEQTSRG